MTAHFSRNTGLRFYLITCTLLVLVSVTLVVPLLVWAQASPPAAPLPCPAGSTPQFVNMGFAEGQQERCVDNAGTVVGTPTYGPTSCSGWNFLLSPVICVGRTLSAFIAGSLVFLSSWVLALSGMLFDWLIDNTVVRFGDSVYTTGVRAAVETAWTAFRDIANIVIIGIFTFIAISIILGLKEFGQKKLIANVLIIAILINFSLLFTKMIVDTSNFTARQIYTASTGQAFSASSNTGQTQSYDIAGAFMRYAGVSGFTDTFAATRQLADNLDNGFTALLHGIFVAVLLFGAAVVLFYGSFLLISRTLLIIFLMITASIAFASYLVPKWASSSYGWNTWWSSLLKSAVLAPVLMFFLWATLTVAAALKQSSGTLGDLVANPNKPTDIAALFNYIIILGLLFISFRLSSALAGKIAGFNWSSALAFGSLGVGWRFAAAPFLRQTAGRLGYAYQGRRTEEARDARDRAARARLQEEEAIKRGDNRNARRFATVARKFEDLSQAKLKRAALGGMVASSRMNIMDTGVMKKAAEVAGVTGFAAGVSSKDTKDYGRQIEERVKSAEKMAAKIAPSAEQNEKAREQIREQRRAQREQLETIKKGAEANAEAVKAFERLPQKLADAQRDQQDAHDTASHNKLAIEEAFRAGIISQAQHTAQMDVEDTRINKAKEIVQLIQSRIETVEKPIKDAEKLLEKHKEETEDAVKKNVAAMGKAGENIAEKVGEKSGDVLTRALGSVTGANKEVGEETKRLYKKKIRTANLRDVVADIQSDSGPSSPSTPPPAGHP